MVREGDGGAGRGGDRSDGRGADGSGPVRGAVRRRSGRPGVHELTESEARGRQTTLRREIAHHHHRYHVLGSPEIPDAVYDALKRELVAVERRHRELSGSDDRLEATGAVPPRGLDPARPGGPMPGRPAARPNAVGRAGSRSPARPAGTGGRVADFVPSAPDPG